MNFGRSNKYKGNYQNDDDLDERKVIKKGYNKREVKKNMIKN